MTFRTHTHGRATGRRAHKAATTVFTLILLVPALTLALATDAEAMDTPSFTAISFGDDWSYLDDGSNQGSQWYQSDFDSSGWAVGEAPLGYGEGNEGTVIDFGPKGAEKYITTYFRREFTAPSNIHTAQLSIIRDDAAAVYINGTLVVSNHLPPNHNYLTLATTMVTAGNELRPHTVSVAPTVFRPGTNVIAVEVHQVSVGSSDVSFDLELVGTFTETPDTEAPTSPKALVSTSAGGSAIGLSWTRSTDDVGVASYRIYRDGTFAGLVGHPGTTFVDAALQSETSYSYRVTAVDAAGNESAPSARLVVSTIVSTTLDLSKIPDSSWQTDGIVNTILPLGNIVYIGGQFTALTDHDGARVSRNNLAAIDRQTGLPTSFNPNMNGKVFALLQSSDTTTLYVGGTFTTARGKSRKRLAAFDIATGELTSFNPAGPNNSVRALDTDGTRLFVGGLFDRVGALRRGHLAAFDIETEALDSDWTPSTEGPIKTLIVDPEKVWIGGNFNTINRRSAVGFGAVSLGDGALLNSEHPGVFVLDMAALGDQLFLAGAGPGGKAFAYDRTTGAQQWATVTDGNVQGLAALGDYVYIGGHYDGVAGVDRRDPLVPVGRLGRLDILTGELDTSWNPFVNGVRGVNDIAAEGFSVYVGGDFGTISGTSQKGFAVFSDEPDESSPAGLISLKMRDADQNGYIDTVEARFDRRLSSCAAPCADGWTLTNTPSNASLNTVTISGRKATLHLQEGDEAPSTAAGRFKIQLDPSSDITDDTGLSPHFPPTKPLDVAAPVPLNLFKQNAGTNGFAQLGDAINVQWSERIDPESLPATTDVVLSNAGSGGNDQLAIPGLIAGTLDMGSAGYLACAADRCMELHQATFPASPITLTSSGSLVTVTLSSCAGDCGEVAIGPRTTVTYEAPSTITDVIGNGAVGATTKIFRAF